MRTCTFIKVALFIILSLFISNAWAMPVIYINDTHTNRNITNQVQMANGYAEASWPWEVQNERIWQKPVAGEFDFINTKDSYTTWLRFQLNNRSGDKQDVILSLNNPFLNKVDLFMRNSHGALERVWYTGIDRGLGSKPYPSGTFSFPISIDNKDIKYIYIKVNSHFDALLEVKLADVSRYSRSDAIEKITNGMITGIMLLVCLYSLVMFLFIHEFRFLYYTIFTSSITICQWLTGSYMTIFSGLIDHVDILKLFLCSNFTMQLGLLLSVSEYIFTKFNKLNRNVTIAFSVGLIGCAIASWFIPVYVSLQVIILSLSLMLIWSLFLVGVSLKQGNLVHLGYVCSLVCFLIGSTIPFLCMVGALSGDFYSKVTFSIVAISAGMVISISLGYRTYQEKQNRLRITRNANLRNKRYLQMLNFSSEGMFSLTMEGEIKQVNPAFCKFLGYENIKSFNSAKIVNFQSLCVNPRDFEQLVSTLLGHVETLKSSGNISQYESICDKKELQLKHVSGKAISAMINLRVSEDINNALIIEGESVDLTKNEDYQNQLDFVANHDETTGTYNRRYMLGALSALYARKNAEQSGMGRDYLCFIRVDNFKYINDSSGHSAGDDFLRTIANYLKNNVKDKYEIIRLNGDEFAIIMSNSYIDETLSYAEIWRSGLSSLRFICGENIYTIVVNIGIVDLSEANNNISMLLSYADTACNIAKELGPNTIHLYSQSNSRFVKYTQNVQMITKILKALDKDCILAVRQKIDSISVAANVPMFELFARINDVDGNVIEPADFLEYVDKFNIMPKIDEWMVSRLISTYGANDGRLLKNISRIFVNISYETICDVALLNKIYSMVHESIHLRGKLCFELRETQIFNKIEIVSSVMNRFRKIGVQFALDNFGSGGNSLKLIRSLPFSYVKISPEFSKEIDTKNSNIVIVKAMIMIAKGLGITTVATNIESAREFKIMADLGVDLCQGYYLGRPENVNLNKTGEIVNSASNDSDIKSPSIIVIR